MLIVPFKPRFIKIANIYFCKLNPHKNQRTHATFFMVSIWLCGHRQSYDDHIHACNNLKYPKEIALKVSIYNAFSAIHTFTNRLYEI